MAEASGEVRANTHEEWLAHVQPTGLVVAAKVLDDRASAPARQSAEDTAQVVQALEIADARAKAGGPYIADPWAFAVQVLEWDPTRVAGAAGGPSLPDEAMASLTEHAVTLRPDYVVLAKAGDASFENWLLFVRTLAPGVDIDKRGALDGWDATPSQQMERLLRETGAPAGLIIGAKVLRLITAPRGESSGWMDFPVQALTDVAGRPMLAGLKLLVGKWGLYLAPKGHRLPDLIAESRRAQANVSTDLAAQVLGALHALLRGLTAAMPHRIGALAADPERSHHLYEGLLTVLMRLVFLLYAEDRDLLPRSARAGRWRFTKPTTASGAYWRSWKRTRPAIPRPWPTASAPGVVSWPCSGLFMRAMPTAGSSPGAASSSIPTPFPSSKAGTALTHHRMCRAFPTRPCWRSCAF